MFVISRFPRKGFLSAILFLFLLLPAQGFSTWNPSTFKKPGKEELKQRLSEMEFKVTQQDGTEPPFQNRYHAEKREGIYVDIISGEPLFSSTDKFDSGTGWPSFTKPLVKENLVEREDNTLFTKRTEVRSKHADSHLGHVFDDGPKPTGLRYCMNSAALRFVPREELQEKGYGEFLALFAKSPGSKDIRTALFAGGCFWCMEPPFDKLEGVIETKVGYAGGTKKNPTYEEVSRGGTGHREVIQVTYDASKVKYRDLLEVYWKNVDPLDAQGQFCDKGEPYKTAIFASGELRRMADLSLQEKQKQLGAKIATVILPESEFYPAEERHQDYYQKNPVRYKVYRFQCGRDKRLKELWK